MEDGENRSLLLVVSADVVSSVVESMKEHNYARYKIAGIAVIDKEMTGKYIDGVKVVANMENAAEYVCKESIDRVSDCDIRCSSISKRTDRAVYRNRSNRSSESCKGTKRAGEKTVCRKSWRLYSTDYQY